MSQLTQETLDKIPEKNWINFIKNKYDADCIKISYFMIGDDADNGFLELETFCTGLNQIFCDVTEEEFLLIQNDTYINEKEKIETALLESTWISRWTENKQALYAVLETEEAWKIVNNIFKELDKIGYEIKRKK